MISLAIPRPSRSEICWPITFFKKINNIYILTKNMFFPHVRNFTSIYGPFSCIIIANFSPTFMEKNWIFFKSLLNFRAYALQLELTKVGYTNFVKFWLQNMSSKIEQAFEKITTPTLTSFFCTFSLTWKRKKKTYLKS